MRVLRTSVGRKLAMALTGQQQLLFLVRHSAGNSTLRLENRQAGSAAYAACSEGVRARFIAKLNREFVKATVHGERGAP